MALQRLFNYLQLERHGTDVTDILAAILIAVSSISSFVVVYRLFFHPLSHVPGPFVARLTGLWRDKKYLGGKWHSDILQIHKQYGRVVRIAPNEVSVIDEQAMKNLYGHGHNAAKTSWYSVWDPPQTAPQLFSELDKKNHGFLRKRVSGAYSMSSILKYEVYIQGCLDLLLERLHEHAIKGETLDMSDWTNAFAFDVVGELGFGSQLGMLKTETDVNNTRKNIFAIFKILSNLGHFPGQAWVLNNTVLAFLLSLIGIAPPLQSFQDWVVQQVQNRLDNIDSVKREDMLQHFCRMKGKDGNPVKLGEILIEAMNVIGAGADTTSIGMRTCLYYVASNPDCYKRLQREVDSFYEENQLDAPLTYLQAQKMPYLQAVIKEATRLLPSIVFQLLRYAPPNFSVRGISIPENTTIGISPIAQNRDTDIWGEDADEFRPDRWLEDETKSKHFESANMTFGGSGPRMCVGRNIALVELHKFLGQFVRNFDFEIANKKNPWRIETYWFAYQRELMMNLTPRKKLPSSKA
ncbi:cytochrome P450 [Corynespora cassiicola Philippines]|uniref:Cytochrome P450 n=1 Tax=Corynespora cassiicola Philippines TaxID=1448308 RepID=A0A2T2P5K7_CORCC|nr:cytochrome P450 [Corynespora cassiicola Philippines]